MTLLTHLLASALALGVVVQDQDPPPDPPAPPGYTQSAACEAVGRRVSTLVTGAEEARGVSPETQALRGQADALVNRSAAAAAVAVEAEALTPEQRADIDALISERIGGADQTQFENAVMNCFVLFGVE